MTSSQTPDPLVIDNGIGFQGPTASASKWRRAKAAKSLLEGDERFYRFQACNHSAQKRTHGVGVYVKGDAAWFSGVMRCGSVWICPICAPRVSALRGVQVQEAIDNAIRAGGGVSLVTATIRHGISDVLTDSLEKFTTAQRYFKSGRAAAELRAAYGYLGEIKTLEVTHGVNGWHPHTHSIWITEKPLHAEDVARLQNALFDLWLASCRKAGLPDPSREHGIDVRGAKYAAEYVAKWGFATEVTGGQAKKGKKGRTPWQLLNDYVDGDRRAGVLWREFAQAFIGKRQLVWSRGLRDLLKLPPELTEQELMDLEDVQEKKRQVIVLDLDTWALVRKTGAQEALLHWAGVGDQDLKNWLNGLRSSETMYNGKLLGPRDDWMN